MPDVEVMSSMGLRYVRCRRVVVNSIQLWTFAGCTSQQCTGSRIRLELNINAQVRQRPRDRLQLLERESQLRVQAMEVQHTTPAVNGRRTCRMS